MGPEGATWTFEPQKGLTHDEVSALDENIARLTRVAERDVGTNFSNTPGAGAAGGFGYGVLTFLKGQIMPGFNVVAEKVGLRERMASTDIVVTGGGRLDFRRCKEKRLMELPRWLNSWTNPVWAIGSVIEDPPLLAGHFDHLSRWFRMTPRWNKR